MKQNFSNRLLIIADSIEDEKKQPYLIHNPIVGSFCCSNKRMFIDIRKDVRSLRNKKKKLLYDYEDIVIPLVDAEFVTECQKKPQQITIPSQKDEYPEDEVSTMVNMFWEDLSDLWKETPHTEKWKLLKYVSEQMRNQLDQPQQIQCIYCMKYYSNKKGLYKHQKYHCQEQRNTQNQQDESNDLDEQNDQL